MASQPAVSMSMRTVGPGLRSPARPRSHPTSPVPLTTTSMSTSTNPTEHADRVPSTSTRAKTILSRGQAAGGLVGLGSSADEVGLGGDSSPRLDKSERLAAPAPGEVDRTPTPPGAGSTVRMPSRAARGAEPAPDTPAAARPRTSVETLSSFSFPSSFSSFLQGGTYTPATLAAEIAELDRSIAEAERSLACAAAAHRSSLTRRAHAGATPYAGPYVPIAVTRFDDDGDDGRRRSERVVCSAPPQTPAPAIWRCGAAARGVDAVAWAHLDTFGARAGTPGGTTTTGSETRHAATLARANLDDVGASPDGAGASLNTAWGVGAEASHDSSAV